MWYSQWYKQSDTPYPHYSTSFSTTSDETGITSSLGLYGRMGYVGKVKLQRLLDGYLDEAIDQGIYKTKKNKLVSSKKSLDESITSLAQTQSGWIEPMEKWINQATSLIEVAECDKLLAKYPKKSLDLTSDFPRAKRAGQPNTPGIFWLISKIR